MVGNNYPQHIGIILDGNRRFAKRLMMKPWEGHRLGFDKLKQLFSWSAKLNIHEITLYCFSMQNFNRPKEEFNYLMGIFEEAFTSVLTDESIHHDKIRINPVGRINLLPKKVQEAAAKAVQATKDYDRFIINIAIAYGGREEIVDTVKKIGRLIEDGKITDKEITEELISKNLYLSSAPDLIIRTGGDHRTSNFLAWQSVYSEWIFLEKTWPEFDEKDLVKCIEEFSKRERRFGK
ncbi:MAG TPA: polyprenyl diphosphate synthase [Candidatus Nanoarchaeia archaeon]|nr:polyprenyl diphosphate synthase [Candidatus Nanoarchaeia archaeon]